jgi:AcrR family transcriptional regulator
MKFDLRQRAALVIAHPGHELRVYGWLETARPIVFVLTDGSGRSGISRLDRTADIISQVGASPGGIFGRFTDAAVYAAILDRDFELFHRLVDELAVSFKMHEIDYVAGDAIEGYNPAHDLCRLMLNAAVRACRLRFNRQIANFDFPLTGGPNEGDPARLSRALRIELDESGFQRKIEAARRYTELADEIEAATRQDGLSSFREEYLWPVCGSQGYVFDTPPFYERYGEKRAAAGAYTRVLRYREHMLPIAAALGAV